MTRSRWSEPERLLIPDTKPKKPRLHPVRENYSEIEKLADEHRQFVSGLRKEARDDCNNLARRMLSLLLTDSVLLVGLALTTQSIYGGASVISLLLRLVYGLGAGIAALLLALSMAFAIMGAACRWEDIAGQSLVPSAMPRRELFRLVVEELGQLRQSLQRSSRDYRRARRFLLISLIPYLVVVAILILQVF